MRQTRKSIGIFLGNKCNCNCAYCHQPRNIPSKKIDIEKLIERIYTFKANNVRFLGGEPLLYWDSIKQIVEEFSDFDVHFNIGTNSLLLNEEKIKFINDYDMSVTISFEGFDKVREYSFNYDNLSKINDIDLSSTLYHGNTDIDKMCNDTSILGNLTKKNLFLYPHLCHPNDNGGDEFGLTKDDVVSLIEQFKQLITTFITEYNKGNILLKYYGLYCVIARRFMKSFFYYGETNCCSSIHMQLDPQGNRLTCLYNPDSIVKDSHYLIEQINGLKNKHPQCLTCNLYPYCGVPCYHATDFNIECMFYKQMLRWFMNNKYHENIIWKDRYGCYWTWNLHSREFINR